ncbi:MAG: hypothetical protein IJU41_05345 [Clostridia bacterium]|nr:hypothetical protein [Clostridia bacterium]
MRKRILKHGRLLLGLVFLFNPCIRLFDILPDAIGIFCLLFAIAKLADLSADLDDARAKLWTLFWIELSKLPAQLVLAYISGSSVGQEPLILTFVFVYAVAECVYGIRAFTALFDGFAYLGGAYDGGDFLAILPHADGKPPRAVGSLTRLTSVFLIVKNALAVLPEFLLLNASSGAGEILPDGRELSNFYPLFTVFAAAISLVIGVIWLVCVLRYFAAFLRHGDFFARLAAVYAEKVLPNTGLFVYRRIRVFYHILCAALLFSVDMYFDEINVLPDFACALFFFLGGLWIAKYVKTKRLMLLSAIYFVSGVFTFVFMRLFNVEYYYRSVQKIERAQMLYTRYAIANAVSKICFLLVVFSLTGIVMQIVREHTGVQTMALSSGSKKPLVRVFERRTRVMRALAIAHAAVSCLYFYFVVDMRSVELRGDFGGYAYFPRFEFAWMIDVLAAVIFAVYTANLFSDLCDEVRFRYRYDE